MLNHENLYFYEEKDKRFDYDQEEFLWSKTIFDRIQDMQGQD